MQIINGVLFYSSIDLQTLPAGKDISEIVPKNGKYWDTRRIEENFYEMKKDVVTKQGTKTLVRKFENAPGPNREQRRKSQRMAVKKRATDQYSFYKRFMKKRGQAINAVKYATPKKWINIQLDSGVSGKSLFKNDMYKACREVTKSKLSIDTYTKYLAQVIDLRGVASDTK